MDEDELADESLAALSDQELERELTLAAGMPGHEGIDRYQALLAERDRRAERRTGSAEL